jgi:hypothetical protein
MFPRMLLIAAIVYTIGVLVIVNIALGVVDRVAADRAAQSRDPTPPKRRRHAFSESLRKALADDRLLPITRSVGETDDQGKPVMDGKGKPKKTKEYVLEKHDAYGILIDPGRGALTWRKLYAALLVASVIITAAGVISPALYGVGFMASLVMDSLIIHNGGKLIAAESKAFDDVLAISRLKLGADATDPHEIINITDWEFAGEAASIANGTVRASEDGQTETIAKEVDAYNKGHRPRIARIRDVPAAMTIAFPISFMKSSTDAFITHINQNVGGGTVEWVAQKRTSQPDGSVRIENGWDFTGRMVTLRTMPPLPDMAKLPMDIGDGPWNAIRLGKTVEGEAVWDLSGQGGSVNGRPLHGGGVGVTTPMSLVPLATDTKVIVVDRRHDSRP